MQSLSLASSIGRTPGNNTMCHTEALLSIDGVLPFVDVVCLGIGPTYTLLVVNRAEVVVQYFQATNSLSITNLVLCNKYNLVSLSYSLGFSLNHLINNKKQGSMFIPPLLIQRGLAPTKKREYHLFIKH